MGFLEERKVLGNNTYQLAANSCRMPERVQEGNTCDGQSAFPIFHSVWAHTSHEQMVRRQERIIH